jgi:hypothetical protein
MLAFCDSDTVARLYALYEHTFAGIAPESSGSTVTVQWHCVFFSALRMIYGVKTAAKETVLRHLRCACIVLFQQVTCLTNHSPFSSLLMYILFSLHLLISCVSLVVYIFASSVYIVYFCALFFLFSISCFLSFFFRRLYFSYISCTWAAGAQSV